MSLVSRPHFLVPFSERKCRQSKVGVLALLRVGDTPRRADRASLRMQPATHSCAAVAYPRFVRRFQAAAPTFRYTLSFYHCIANVRRSTSVQRCMKYDKRVNNIVPPS